MNRGDLKILLESVRAGDVGVNDALATLEGWPGETIDGAHIDHARAVRQGFPEVIYGAGKTPEQIATIFETLLKRNPNVLATRANEAAFEKVRNFAPDAVFHSLSGVIGVRRDFCEYGKGLIVIACAGTSDLPVAEEAKVTCELMGNRVAMIVDVGVAGVHRLFAHRETLRGARVVICVAGMEAALASVVGGLVSVPVIGVPTSVGYGASFGGVAALLGMLNSCASGVAVVNIDNGFGAACVAALINRLE
jgi:NCAIR mutase (PurE)-related protein